MTAVCGADKNAPAATLTTPTKQQSVERPEKTDERKRHSNEEEPRSPRVSSEQRRGDRRDSGSRGRDRSADRELPPPASSSPTRAKTRDCDDEKYRLDHCMALKHQVSSDIGLILTDF